MHIRTEVEPGSAAFSAAVMFFPTTVLETFGRLSSSPDTQTDNRDRNGGDLTAWVASEDISSGFIVEEDEEGVGEGTEPPTWPTGPDKQRDGGSELWLTGHQKKYLNTSCKRVMRTDTGGEQRKGEWAGEELKEGELMSPTCCSLFSSVGQTISLAQPRCFTLPLM